MFRPILFAALCMVAALTAFAAEPDGLVLPPGFHASVVADGLANARHIAIRDNGDIYVSTSTTRNGPPAGIIALRLGADHNATATEHFSTASGGTGLRFYKGALYAASPTTVSRFAFAGDAANKTFTKAAYRPVGEAVGPDGSLYVVDSSKGRLWRIFYGNGN